MRKIDIYTIEGKENIEVGPDCDECVSNKTCDGDLCPPMLKDITDFINELEELNLLTLNIYKLKKDNHSKIAKELEILMKKNKQTSKITEENIEDFLDKYNPIIAVNEKMTFFRTIPSINRVIAELEK